MLSERELKRQDDIWLFESLSPFALMFEEDEELPRRRSCKVKYDYDFRVVVARAQERDNASSLHR